MTLIDSIHRWFLPAADSRCRFEGVIYFDGPLTKWNRSHINDQYEEHNGLRIPLTRASGEIMPRPDEREIVDHKEFRSASAAQFWVLWRLKGFDTSKLVGEVRPL